MEPEQNDTTPEEYEALLARVRTATATVSPGNAVTERVTGALLRRRRRRRRQIGLASAAAVAVLGVTAVVVVPSLVGDDTKLDPSQDDAAPSAVQAGLYRPAGFFQDVVGGQAVPSITRYYRTSPEVRFTARFEWSPEPDGKDRFLGDLSLERFRATPEKRCASLPGEALCDVLDDGSVLARYEVAADGADLAPLNGLGRIDLPGSEGTLRGVTYLRGDDLAVTVLVCNCSSEGGGVLQATPPVSFETLEDVVTDPSWALPAAGG